MSTVTQTTTASSAQALFESLNASREKTTSTKDVDPQDRFLKLLVTQLKNQDPLNPMDNAQMTSQMAQISTVEGINKLNATLQMILDGSNENQAMQAAALVGRGVLVPGSGLQLANGGAIGGFEIDGPADRVSVTVKDASGVAVRTFDFDGVDAGSHILAWDGYSDNGSLAADGKYSFSVSAWRGEEAVGSRSLEAGIVSSISRDNGQISLSVGEMGNFTMNDVRQIL